MKKELRFLINQSKAHLTAEEIKENEKILSSYPDWEFIIAQLIYNKLAPRAYIHLTVNNQFDYIPKYFKKSIYNEYQITKLQQQIFQKEIDLLTKELNQNNIKYCILKGPILQGAIFPEHTRSYNDIDILVDDKDLPKAASLLYDLGFTQGHYDLIKNEIKKPDRKEIIFSRLLTHEEVPFMKITDNPLVPCINVDLQVEYMMKKKEGYNINTTELLENRIIINNMYSLNYDDFLIQLCTHLYGEAVIVSEILAGKDLSIAKFADIYEWVRHYGDKIDWDIFTKKAQEGHCYTAVSYAFTATNILYKSRQLEEIINKYKLDNVDLDVYGSDKEFKWNKPFIERLIDINRVREVAAMKQ